MRFKFSMVVRLIILALTLGAVVTTASPSYASLNTLTVSLTSPATFNSPSKIVAGGGYIWVASGTPVLYQVNSSDGTIIRSITLTAFVNRMTYGASALWAELNNGSVVKVTSTGETTYILNVCPVANGMWNNGIAVSQGYVGVSCFLSAKFSTINATGTPAIIATKTLAASYPPGLVSDSNYFYVLNTMLAAKAITRLNPLNIMDTPTYWNVPMYMNAANEFTIDNSYIYVLNQNTGTPFQLTRISTADGSYTNVDVSPSGSSFGAYAGIVSDNTDLYYSNSQDNTIKSVDVSGNNYGTAISTTSPRGLTYDGTYIWGIMNGQIVRFGIHNPSQQDPITPTLSPTTHVGTPLIETITISTSGGSGAGAISYSIDPSSTATGCTLDNPSHPTSISSTSDGTCVIKTTKAGDGTYVAISTLTTFTFTTIAPPLTSTLSPTSHTGSPYVETITVSTSGGLGTGTITYSIDPASTATGCILNDTTTPTRVSAGSSGTCLIKATKATDGVNDETSTVVTFTFSASAPPPPPPPPPHTTPSVSMPDPIQSSRIDKSVANCSGSNPVITISGAYDRYINNITLNGASLDLSMWHQSPIEVTIQAPLKLTSNFEVQIYNGAAPVLPLVTVACSAPVAIPPVVIPSTPTDTTTSISNGGGSHSSDSSTSTTPTKPGSDSKGGIDKVTKLTKLVIPFNFNKYQLSSSAFTMLKNSLASGSKKIKISSYASNGSGQYDVAISLDRALETKKAIKKINRSISVDFRAFGSAPSGVCNNYKNQCVVVTFQ